MKKLLRFSLMALFAVFGMSNAVADVIDELTWDNLLESGKGTAYQAFSGMQITSYAIYAGSASSGSNKYIQLRSSSGSGIISTESGGKIKSVTITFNEGTTDRSIDIYGKNEAYESASDLYDNAKKGTLLGSIAANAESFVLEVEGDYAYIGLRSKSGAIYIDKIEIEWDGNAAPVRAVTKMKKNDNLFGGKVGAEIDLAGIVTVVDEDGNEVDGADITWESKNEDIVVISGGTLRFLSAGQKATITATFDGDNAYKGCNTSFTLNVLTESTESEDIPSIQDTAPETTKSSEAEETIVEFNNVIVTKVFNPSSSSYNVYLSDENHCGLMIYATGEGNDIGLKEGQVLNGQAYAKKMKYLGTYELVNFSKAGLTITEGTVEPIEMAINDIEFKHQGALVTVKGVKFASSSDAEVDGYFSDGNYNLVYKDRFGAEPNLENGETYDVTGIIINWSYTACISPRTADDITLAASTNIQNLTIDTDASAPIYTLDGRRVDQNYRGVVIKNGVKRIQK